jgi:uncharacterized C2H2 Zn-finger protein
MGEYAEMMIDGFVDQYTGEVIDGQSPGYPRSRSRNRWAKKTHGKADGDVRCPKCGRYFRSTEAVEHHARDMHTPEGQERRRKQQLGL